MSLPTEVVVFRRWKDTGDIIALFPEFPTDTAGNYCESYEHVGQHGGADYYGVVQATRPVSPEEYATLARELELIGYCLRPVRRATREMHDRRRESARRQRT
jgi:hypothetical protein